jgi:hypothetical protein
MFRGFDPCRILRGNIPVHGQCQTIQVNMQTRELNRATIGVANTTGKERRVGRTGLPGLVSLMAAGIFVALALMPARADEEGVHKEIEALEAQVAALQGIVGTLQTNNSALQSEVNKLQTQLAAVRSNNALKLGRFVSVVSGLVDGVNGPHIYFTGANIHIVSGSTTTADSVTGLGNLIIGYNEIPIGLSPGDRGGSHNLVIGRFNRFLSAASGGLVAGEFNTISAPGASVSGGAGNTASDAEASVSGGSGNTASGEFSSVSGGLENTATDGLATSVSGGQGNTARGDFASVSGGKGNNAGGELSVVIGGQGVTAGNLFSIAPHPPFP